MQERPLFFLSDFGTADPYAGLMKARALAEGFAGPMVDLSHGVPPQDVLRGAAILEDCLPWLPARAVVCAVVDPGVGSRRAALAVSAGERVFVAPDNGLLTPVLQAGPDCVREIDTAALGLEVISATFHGRDVFAPVAARIASGRLSAEEAGPAPENQPVLLDFPAVSKVNEEEWVLAVLYVDGFGNAATNLRREALPPGRAVEFFADGRLLGSLQRTYADAAEGEPVVYVNSFGRVEVAVRGGSAAERLPLRPGAAIVMKTAGRREE